MDEQLVTRKDPRRPIIIGTLLFASVTLCLLLLAFIYSYVVVGCNDCRSGRQQATINSIYATNTAVFQAISATETSKAATAIQQRADATEMARIKAIPLPRFPLPR